MATIEQTIGLVCATTTEFNLVSQRLNDFGFRLLEGDNVASFRWITGSIGDKEVVLIKTGTGKVYAAATTQYIIDRFRPDLIIGLGVAGALDPSTPVGSVVVTDVCEQWDLDLSAVGVQPDRRVDHGVIFERVKDSLRNPCITGTIITGDTFVGNPKTRDALRNKHDAIAVDMESAAVALVCNQNNIPFLIVKGISDSADSRAFAELHENIGYATMASFDACNRLGIFNF